MLHAIHPYFAVFQDEPRECDYNYVYEQRYKLVSPDGCELPSMDDQFSLCRIKERVEPISLADQEPRRVITADAKRLYMWKTAYSVFHPRLSAWIPVLDFSEPCYPGQFLYTSKHETAATYRAHCILQRSIRAEMLLKIREEAMPETIGIPKFVRDIMKADAIRKNDICPISMTPFKSCGKILLTNCFHMFEATSIEEWLKKSSSCPVCKQKIRDKYVV